MSGPDPRYYIQYRPHMTLLRDYGHAMPEETTIPLPDNMALMAGAPWSGADDTLLLSYSLRGTSVVG